MVLDTTKLRETHPERCVRLAVAAEMLNVDKDTVRKWIGAGMLPAWKLGGGNIVVDPADFPALMIPVAPDHNHARG